MGQTVESISRASWWQVGLFVGLAIMSLSDMALPCVVGGVVLLALALLISVCKLPARREEDDRSAG